MDKSILNREDLGASVRYLMLDTLREYGRVGLAASGEEGSTRERHRQYFAGIADDPVFGSGAREVLDRLRLEHGNLRAALEFCATEPAQVVYGLDLASSLWKFWTAIGAFAEGRTWLTRLLENAERAEPYAMEVTWRETRLSHARALCKAGWLATLQNDLPTAVELLQRSGAEASELGDRSLDGYIALYSGTIATSQGRNAEARTAYEQALDSLRAASEPTGVAMTLRRLAMAESLEGHHDRAVAYYEECLKLCESHGEEWDKAYTLWGLGLEARRQGNRPHARALLRESIRLNSSMGDERGVALGIEGLAWVAADQQEAELAAGMLGAAHVIWQTLDAPMSGFLQLTKAHDDCEGAVRGALGEQAYEAAFGRGAQLSPRRATEYALDPGSLDTKSAGLPRLVQASTPLTRREQEIAGLVATGLTNNEIASQLVISVRTAEAHVEHILTKLGFRSRTQIAAWLMEQHQAHEHREPPRA